MIGGLDILLRVTAGAVAGAAGAIPAALWGGQGDAAQLAWLLLGMGTTLALAFLACECVRRPVEQVAREAGFGLGATAAAALTGMLLALALLNLSAQTRSAAPEWTRWLVAEAASLVAMSAIGAAAAARGRPLAARSVTLAGGGALGGAVGGLVLELMIQRVIPLGPRGGAGSGLFGSQAAVLALGGAWAGAAVGLGSGLAEWLGRVADLVPTDSPGARLAVFAGTSHAGSSPLCDIVVQDASPVHARFTWHRGVLSVGPAAAAALVAMNGQGLSGPRALADGDTLDLGPARFRVAMNFMRVRGDRVAGGGPRAAPPDSRTSDVAMGRYAGPRFVVVEGPGTGQIAVVPEGPSGIGRSEECAIRLADASVAPVHARLSRVGREVRVTREPSSGPVALDRTPVDSATLTSGARLRLGETVLLYLDG